MVALMRDGKLTAAGRAELRKTAAGRRKLKKMTKKKSKQKHYPVQRTIRPEETTAGAVFSIVRSDKLLSNVNHRLYRQSRVYSLKVSIDPDYDNHAAQQVNVYVLADTWYNQKAYQLAKRMFDENSVEELAQLNTSKARWNDFRVDHGLPIGALNGTETKAYSFAPNGAAVYPDKVFYDEGEYLPSEIHDAAGNGNTFRWSGTGVGTWNIIDQYDLTGNTDAEPSTTVNTVAYDGIDDTLDDGQMEHLSDHGNLPPYSENTFSNGCWVLAGTLRAGGPERAKMSTGFINAPCGLVILETLESDLDGVSIEYKAGDYKGVHAPSYLE